MPSKLPRPCRWPGCPALTQHKTGYCDAHRQAVHAEYSRFRRDVDEQKFYRSRLWRNISESYRRSHSLCEVCGIRPAEMVHHKVAIRDGGSMTDWDNLQALCNGCHNTLHRGG